MKIITDTASLFSPAKGMEENIMVVPACVINENIIYKDYEELSTEEFLEMIRQGATPTTSQPAIGDLIDIFEGEKEETLALFIGDGLSGGYQNAVGAKKCMDDGSHIRIIDTKTLAGAEHYLVEKAIDLRRKGADIDTIEKEVKKSIETSASFVIPADFEFLKRSGRLTPIAAKISTLIKVVPVMTQTADRKKITLFTMKRSWKKATEVILGHLKKLGVDESYKIFVCHGGNLPNAEQVLSQVKLCFPEVETKLMSLSPTMMTHGGPGCVLIQAIQI